MDRAVVESFAPERRARASAALHGWLGELLGADAPAPEVLAGESDLDGPAGVALVAGSGALIAATLHGTLCPGREGLERACRVGATTNAMMMAVDAILDDYPALAPPLLAALTPSAVRRAMADEPGTRGSHFPVDPAAPAAARSALRLLEAFFREVRALARHVPSRARTLAAAVERCYAAQVASVGNTLEENAPPATVRRILRDKSALPFRLMGDLVEAAAGVPAGASAVPPAAVDGAADVLWLADDLADLTEDTLNGVWNYGTLEWATRREPAYGAILAALDYDDRLARLRADDVEAVIVQALLDRYEEVQEALVACGAGASPLARSLLPWVFVHLDWTPSPAVPTEARA